MILVLNRKTPTENYEQITFNLGGSKTVIKRKRLEGRECLVVPCVMITEGVHEGSNGPGLYLEEHTARVTESWNHMPVVVYHPPSKNGKAASARSETIINTRKVGIVLNTRWDDKAKKLRCEVWLDIKRTKKIDNRILKAVTNGKKVEVSTGLFLRRKKKEGVWNSKPYKWVAIDQTPDHLAILPDQVGACSINDGAGLLQLNSARLQLVGLAAEHGLVPKPKDKRLVKNRDASFTEITSQLSDLLAAKYGKPGKSWGGYITEVFPDRVVFRIGGYYDDSITSLQMISYKADKDGKVSLSGDAKQVTRVTEYKTVGTTNESFVYNSAEGSTLTSKRTGKMLNTKKKARIVRRLIANSDGVWSAADKKTLMDMPDIALKKIVRQAEATEQEEAVHNQVKKIAVQSGHGVNSKTGVTNENNSVESEGKKKKVKPPSEEEWLRNAPASVQAVVNQGKRVLDRRKATLIEVIENSGKNPFGSKWLQAQDIDVLEGMAQLANNSADTEDEDEEDGIFKPGFRSDFSGAMGAAPVQNRRRKDDEDDDEEGLPLPSLYPTENKTAVKKDREGFNKGSKKTAKK